MGRELASAIARWIHLDDLGVRPRLVHVADIDESVLAWYERLDSAPRRSTDYCQLLADDGSTPSTAPSRTTSTKKC